MYKIIQGKVKSIQDELIKLNTDNLIFIRHYAHTGSNDIYITTVEYTSIYDLEARKRKRQRIVVIDDVMPLLERTINQYHRQGFAEIVATATDLVNKRLSCILFVHTTEGASYAKQMNLFNEMLDQNGIEN